MGEALQLQWEGHFWCLWTVRLIASQFRPLWKSKCLWCRASSVAHLSSDAFIWERDVSTLLYFGDNIAESPSKTWVRTYYQRFWYLLHHTPATIFQSNCFVIRAIKTYCHTHSSSVTCRIIFPSVLHVLSGEGINIVSICFLVRMIEGCNHAWSTFLYHYDDAPPRKFTASGFINLGKVCTRLEHDIS